MNLNFILNGLGALFSIGLGVALLSANTPFKKSKRYLGFFIWSSAAWITLRFFISNFIIDPEIALNLSRFIQTLALLSSFGFWWFVISLTEKPVTRLIFSIGIVTTTIFGLINQFSDLIVINVKANNWGGYENIPGPVYMAFGFLILIMLSHVLYLITATIYKKIQQKEAYNQYVWIIISIFSLITFGVTTGIIIPSLGLDLPRIGYLGVLLAEICLLFALTKNNLLRINFSTLNIQKRIILSIVIFALLPLWMTVFIGLSQANKQTVQSSTRTTTTEMNLINQEFTSLLGEYVIETQALKNTPPVTGIIRASNNQGVDPIDESTYQQWEDRLESTFSQYLKTNTAFIQLRYIAANGDELIRVDRQSGPVKIIPQNQLQNKSDRYYFQEGLNLAPDEVFISEIDLNREGTPATISVPYTPTTRIIVPVYEEERIWGLVVANVNIQKLLTRIESHTADNEDIYLTNSSGNFMIHPNRDKTWGGASNLNTGHNLELDFPNIRFDDDSIPIIDDQGFVIVFRPFFYGYNENQYQGLIIKKIPREVFVSPLPQIERQVWIITGVVSFIIILGSAFISKTISQPLKKLVGDIEKFEKSGFTHRTTIKSSDEVGLLAEALNNMASKIEKSYSQLEKRVKERTQELNQALEASSSANENLEKTKIAMLNLLEDIDQERQQSIRQTQDLQKFQLAVENASDQIVITDPDGIILYANKATEDLTQYPVDEIVGQKVGSSLWGKQMPKEFYQDLWHHIKEKKEPYVNEMINKRKDGSLFPVEIDITPILDDQGEVQFFVSITSDITQTKEFQQVSERLQLATNAAHMGIWDWDIRNDILVWDDQMYKIYGVNKDDFSGAYDAWQKGLHPDDKERAEKELQEAIEGKKDFDTEFKVVWPSGEVRVIKAMAKVRKGRDGKAERIVGINMDITKEYAIDKMKTEFISLASHQLRTPLTSIKWFLEMILAGDMGELNPEQKEGIDNAFRSNERMIALVDSLLNISRIESGRILVEPEPTNIHDLVESVIEEVKVRADEKNQEIILNINDSIPEINLDPKLIRHVYMNILTNAIKYSPQNTKVTITLSKDGENLVNQISDQGFGIPQDQQDRIFEKFFRGSNIVKKVTDGNGLGMYLVKSIVKSSGGDIWFESKENEGTTFWFTVPLSGVEAQEGEVKLS